MKFLRALAVRLAIVLGIALSLLNASQAREANFDYYVLALSWSPAFCIEEGNQSGATQCRAQRPFAFVLHGLWPQYERGFPKDCPTATPRVPRAVIESMLDIMPAFGLVGHQWRKHGTCTGLTYDDYFWKSRKAFEGVKIPSAYVRLTQPLVTDPSSIERAFLAANSGLTADMIAVTCSSRHMREVRICLTKDLKPRACGRDVARGCSRDKIVMPPVR